MNQFMSKNVYNKNQKLILVLCRVSTVDLKLAHEN